MSVESLPSFAIDGTAPARTFTMSTPGLLDAIESKLIAPRSDCLLWPGAMDRGYGRIWVDGSAKRVHRVVWELKHGPIPDDLTIDHLCRVRPCVNTDHMELVTAIENIRRKPQRHLVALTVACRNGHRWTPETTGSKGGARRCLVCDKACRERAKQRKRAASP